MSKRYIERLILQSDGQEMSFIMNRHRTCYNGIYPYKIFPKKGLRTISFAPITIFYGGNGSGKTTLLNIIAEKTKVTRHSTFSGGAFFQKYVTGCEITGRTIPANSQILTSDDVFDYLLNIRYLNDGIDVRREELFEEYMEYKIATSSEEKSSGGSGVGCNPTLIFGILVVLWLLSKLSS